MKQTMVAGVAVSALLAVLSACGGADDASEPTSKPTTSASPTPAVPPQPEGADGVTVEIQNWDAYASDPAVLAWKQATEVFIASGNQRKVLPGMRDAFGKALFARYFRNMRDYAWKRDWHTASRIPATIRQSRTTGAKAELVTCLWGPAISFLKKSGEFVVKADKGSKWEQERVELSSTGGRWVVTKETLKGDCPGTAPR